MKQAFYPSIRGVIHYILYGNVEKTFYIENRVLLDSLNTRSLKSGCCATAIICLLISVFSRFVTSLRPSATLFLCGAVAFAALYLAVRFFVIKRQYLANRFYYFASSIFYALVIISATYFSPDKPAGLTYIFIVLLPAVYIDKPITSVLQMLIVSTIFAATSIVFKRGTPAVLHTDLLDTCVCIIVSALCIYFIRNMHVLNIRAMCSFKNLSEIDGLTGVFNKTKTEEACQEYLDSCENESMCALMILDLDNFKKVNDSLGHMQGDVLLKKVGTILFSTFRSYDIVGRIGGDEFLVLMKDITQTASIEQKAKKVLFDISNAFTKVLADTVSCSIGIIINRNKELTYNEMFFRADKALYEAKECGKNQYLFFTDDEQHGAHDKPLLLVADDADVTRLMLSRGLEDSFDVLVAANGKQALLYLRKYSAAITAVLLDLEMPLLNGFDVLKEMRADANLSKIPVIIVSMLDKAKDTALELGAVDFISKPFTPAAVKRRLDAVLGK